ncbi:MULTISPECIES: hypothetical protein [Clostridium]|uniref:hypothetical protein n=1 Tax=Clostridium TaxID=1485 RepID=UPI000774A405|nr:MULTISPECIES: hypothetical protein [Clostridium]AUM96150.1 hypothetical protein RSJ11_13715 [Clostridium sporogenes]AVQ53601.1 hypothetical protein C7M59_12330 [Clostridium botulinum]
MSSDNREFQRSLEEATYRQVMKVFKNAEKACTFLEGEGKKNCPVDQGPLRAAMFHDVKLTSTEIVGSVANSMEYAPYVHQGTGIYAKDGNGRKTPWKYKVEKGKYAGWHITKGQKPNQFLEKAKLNNKDKINNILGGD